MAIARITNTTDVDNGGVGTTLTISFTASGSNTNLYVASHNQGTGSLSATCNGVSMTQVGQIDFSASNRMYLFGLAGATTGNIVITSTNSGDTIHGSYGYFSGSSQTLPTGNAVKTDFLSTATSSPVTLNPVSIADNSWAFTVNWALDHANANSTNNTLYNTGITGGDSNADLGTSGTETVNFAWTGGTSRYVRIAAVFAPPVAAATGNFFLFM